METLVQRRSWTRVSSYDSVVTHEGRVNYRLLERNCWKELLHILQECILFSRYS